MRKITQAEYDALPIIDGSRQCPGHTSYSGVQHFGNHASFSEGARFGNHAIFGECASFGRGAIFGDCARFGNHAIFGECASFGAFATFGNHAIFGGGAIFGAFTTFGGGAKLEGNKPLLGNAIYSFGGFGSVNRTTYFIPMRDGIYVRCGCWAGDIEEFRERVADVHGESAVAREYLAICDVAEMRRHRELQATDGEGE
jgi:hypothetical protein